jgi:hypothetical protein
MSRSLWLGHACDSAISGAELRFLMAGGLVAVKAMNFSNRLF